MHRIHPPAGTVVALHGHADEPASAREWGRRVAPAGWDVVAPGAPRDGDGARSWFTTGPRGAERIGLEQSATRIVDLVAEIRRRSRPVVVVGFSQGGALALSLGLARSGVGPANGPSPDAVVSVCGFLPELDDEGFADLTGEGTGSTPTLLVAGASDEVVAPFLSEDAAATLAAAGRPVTSVVESGGHEVSAQAAGHIRSWITGVLGRPVRVSLGLPVDRVAAGVELVSGDAIAELAAAYEELCFDAAYVTDHPAPDDRWLEAGGHHAMEPTVALAAAAAATRTLLVHTNVYVVPYRNPFLAAKALASLDVVSSGRLIAGVAAGYLRSEFGALGVDFDDRTERLEDTLRLLPRIWGDASVSAEGRGYSASAVTALPRPTQRPHPPIWVGGNSRAAIRRAVTLAQGWSPFPTPVGMHRAVRTSAISDLDGLRGALEHAAGLCEAVGRSEPLTVCFVPFALGAFLADPVDGLAPLVEEVAELEAMGVDWVALSVPGSTRREVIDRAAMLSEGLGLR